MTISVGWFIALVIWAALAKAIAGVAVGLWLGERGRRIAAERMLLAGTTEKPQPRRIGAPVPSEEIIAGNTVHFSDKSVEQGAEHLMAEAREHGLGLTIEDARDQARFMLQQLVPFAAEEDPDTGAG